MVSLISSFASVSFIIPILIRFSLDCSLQKGCSLLSSCSMSAYPIVLILSGLQYLVITIL